MEVSDEMDRGMDISVHRGGICRAAPTQERILSCILWWKGTAKLGGITLLYCHWCCARMCSRVTYTPVRLITYSIFISELPEHNNSLVDIGPSVRIKCGIGLPYSYCASTRNVLTFVNTTAIAYRQNSAFLR